MRDDEPTTLPPPPPADAFPVAWWAREKRAPAWAVAVAKGRRGWDDDTAVTADDFDAALDEAGALQLGYAPVR